MKEKVLRWGFFIFLFSIPFGTKKFLFDAPFPITNWYTNEYTSVFLYASDTALIFFVGVVLWTLRKEFFQLIKQYWIFVLFFGLAMLSIGFAGNTFVALYYSVRLFFVICAAFAVATVIKEKHVDFSGIAWTIGIAAVIQSIICFLQFLFQKSVGLWFLGESIITEQTKGVAHVPIDGANVLRSYGTLPHSNILAGFLVLGLASFLYLFLKNNLRFRDYLRISAEHASLGVRMVILWLLEKAFIAVCLFSILLGLIFSFSRSGWITAAVVVFLALVYGLWNKELRRQALVLCALLFFTFALLISTMSWAIFPRAHLYTTEGSVAERITFNKIGWDIMRTKPFGVGIGNELIYGVSYKLFQNYGLKQVWDWQPIHNLCLLIASETGIIGLVVFLAACGMLLYKIRWRSPESVFAGIIFVSLLVFGLFDHFLWDLEIGKLMLWSIIGILLGFNYENHLAAD